MECWWWWRWAVVGAIKWKAEEVVHAGNRVEKLLFITSFFELLQSVSDSAVRP